MPETWTTAAEVRWARLEEVDDELCDIYSGQDTHVIFGLTEDQRAWLRYFLGRAITHLREWQVAYGEHKPGEAPRPVPYDYPPDLKQEPPGKETE